MNVEVVKTMSGLIEIGSRWQELLTQSNTDPVFGSFSWMQCWWETFGTEAEHPLFVTVKDKNEAKGFAALYLSPEHWGPVRVNTLKPMGAYTADYQDVLFPLDARACVYGLIEFLLFTKDWDVFSLCRLPQTSPTRHHFTAAAKENRLNVVTEMEELCPYFKLEGTFETYMANRFSANFRNRIRRMKKRLSAMGDYRFELITSPRQVEEALPRLEDLEKRSWKGKKGLGIFNTPKRRQFFSKISRMLSTEGKVAIHLQWLDDKLISYHYGFISHGRFYDYSLAFDPEFQNYSPGLLSLVDLIERCYGMGLHTFDFLRGNESYKTLWTDTATQNINLHIFAPAIKSRILAASLITRLSMRKIKRFLKPSLKNAFDRIDCKGAE